jgi:hypothetical protein
MDQKFEANDLSNQLPQNAGNDGASNAPISGVSFSEKKRPPLHPEEKNYGTITKLVIKTGLIKNEREAQIALVVLAVIIFALAIIIWPNGGEVMLPPNAMRGAL